MRITELHLEQFKKEGVDYDIKHAKTRWRQLFADLRYLFDSGLPRIWKGERWGKWDEETCLRYGGKIIDALRSVYFPLMPPSKDDPRYNTSYWKAYRKAEEKGYIKSKPPKLEELSEWDKKRKDIIKTSLEETKRKIDGLYLTYPHGELFWTKEKTLLIETRKFDLSRPHYLIDDGLCYGIISFKEPKRITKEQFFTEDLKKKHRILDTEAWQWWRMSRDNAVEPELWVYEVKKFEPFEIPERVKIPKGIQVIIDADNIEFVGKDEEQPARIDWPTTATKEAKTDYIKFYGTKGYIEEENDEHKYHTCILLSLNDTNILLDYGERHPEEIKERIDVVLNSHCFPGETLITMADGSLKRIDEIKIGDFILDAFGKLNKVLRVFSHPYKGKATKAFKKGLPFPLIATENHEVRKGKDFIGINETSELWIPCPSFEHIKCCKSIKTFDFIKDLILIEEPDCYIIGKKKKNGEIIVAGNRYLKQTIPKYFEINEKFLKLLGYFFADGGVCEGRRSWSVNFTMGYPKSELLDEIEVILSSYKVKFQRHPVYKKNAERITILSKLWMSFFKNLFYKDKKKVVPEFIFGLKPKYISIFLESWIKADGHYFPDTKRWVCFVKDLSNCHKLFLLSLKAGKNARLGNVQPGWIVRWYDNPNTNTWNLESGKAIIFKDIEKEEIDFEGTVYNLETESGSYIANMIGVKNCHIDHICPEISSFVCPLYISKETLSRVDFSLPEDIRIYEARKAFSIGNIKIISYPVYHSIRAPMHIFKIETDNLAIGVMTDFLGFRDKEDEASFYPNLDIVIIDGSSITRDLKRWKDFDKPFGHESVVHQIERIKNECKKNPIVILTHIGREGIEWGDLQILQYLHERFAGMHIYIAKDGSVFDLKTRRFTEVFKGEQICKDIVANLPSFTWIPEFTSITGSTLFTKDHAPRDLDVMCKAEEINGKWYIPVDTSLLLKLQRAYQYATKKVLGKAIKPEFPPPALIGANWASMPAYDLKLVPRKNPEVRRTGEEEFEEKVYGVDFKEKLRLRTKSKDIEKMAQQSLKEDKIKPLRFFMPLKPIRVQGKHGERNTPERLVELFEPQHYPVYNSVKRDGFRVQIHADGDKVVIYSEDGNDITKQLPTIVDAVKKLKAKSVVLDAECELWEYGHHHPREAAIAKIHSKAIDDKDLIANLFDCVYLNGEDLHKEPFEKRWKALNSLGIKYSKETNLNPEEKLNIIPHILCKTPKELLRETERMRKVKSSEGCVAIAHNATYPLDGKPDDNSFCKFHNNVVVRGIVIQPVQTKVETVYNLIWGCLAGKHEILKKDQTEVGAYEKVLTIGSTFAAPYVKRGSVIEVECETINHIIHEDIEGNPVEITAWAPRFMRVVLGAKPDSIDDILRKARKENHVLQEKIIKSDGTVIYKEARKELYCFLTEEPTLTSKISDRFGAAKYAIFFEPATYHFEAVDLSNFVTGIEITDLIKERRATEVITNQIGRFSREALDKAGIKIVFTQGKVEDYLNKKLGESPLLKEAILKEQDPYMQYFDEDKEHKFCAQHHYRCALKEVLKEIGREDLWPKEEPSPEEWAKLWPKWWPEVRKVLEDYYNTHPNFKHSPSVHCDLRMETDTKGVLIGFTLNDQIKDRPQFFPLRLRKSEGKYSAEEYDDNPENWKINYNTGEFAKRVKKSGAKAPVSLISERKSQEPSDWLTYEGFQSPRNVAATRYGYAVLHLIRKLGVVETGYQSSYFHEYFLHFPKDSNKPPFYWRLMFRYLKRPFKEAIEQQDYEILSECVYLEDDEALEEGIYLEAERIIPVSEEGWGRNQTGWLCIYGVDKTPYIISDRAVKLKRMCPYPYSALPRYIKKQIPPEFHYWKEKDMKKRIEIRDALVKAIKEKKVILKESIARDFTLQIHYSDPSELVKRKSPAHKHYDLRLNGDLKKKTGHIFHAVLELNPLEVDSTSAYLKKCKGDEGGVNWMEVGKDKTVKFTKGYGTFEKNEPGYVKALDWGRVLVLEDSPLFKKFQFKGKQLKGIWIMHRSSPETDIWTFERSKNIG